VKNVETFFLKVDVTACGQQNDHDRFVSREVISVRRGSMRFYTIKLPKFLGGMIRGIIEAFNKKK